MSTETETPTPSYRAAAAPRLRDRVLGLRAVAAVSLASLILGGAGGAVLGAVSNGGESSGPGGVRGQFQQGQPGQVPGQLPPGTAPQQGVQPDTSGETTSGTNT
ncbi:hypothetical protein FB382_002999 [Nocardioides ginsengisegetis]|uniref:Uncharacterized protein n=1 Tax=Nocardioides ginsengisegetis TaxID=661491 RepID=A0A7W3J1S1_9ACTN|nr:hypothetical protein [Nocardioides ginsengisegetis]MBA8804708.1 hypothetical protein [Nocardioides ginsengisegetis]